MVQHVTPNRREYFRLDLNGLPAIMRIIEIGQRPITTHPREVLILNAGGGGLYIQAEDDLPIRRTVVAQFEFSLGGQEFSFRGVLTRKVDDLKSYQYGVKFIDVEEYQRGQLLGVLGRMQVEMRRTGVR